MEGSLGAWPKPRSKKMLSNWKELKQLCGEATVVCGLPQPRYIKETCCQDSEHIDNFHDEGYQDIFRKAADMVKVGLPGGGLPGGNHLRTAGRLWR